MYFVSVTRWRWSLSRPVFTSRSARSKACPGHRWRQGVLSRDLNGTIQAPVIQVNTWPRNKMASQFPFTSTRLNRDRHQYYSYLSSECACVCVHMRVRAYTCVCVRLCTCICTYVCVPACTWVYASVRAFVYNILHLFIMI